MVKWPLPSGWEWKAIRTVVSQTERRGPSINPDQSFTYVDIGSIDSARGTIHEPKMLRGREAPSRPAKSSAGMTCYSPPPDLTFAM